jgi:hypothetical protein
MLILFHANAVLTPTEKKQEFAVVAPVEEISHEARDVNSSGEKLDKIAYPAFTLRRSAVECAT